ncbi:hypothetical protein HAX54_049367 [Datura stramonium]|uniref:Uncharacterized protein n=1 Tax=Datura stramonium TaxID=4076 RepID=A0ABS8WMT8_DATST|nr:hypothetical protein [Datura stramonium]
MHVPLGGVGRLLLLPNNGRKEWWKKRAVRMRRRESDGEAKARFRRRQRGERRRDEHVGMVRYGFGGNDDGRWGAPCSSKLVWLE